MDEHRLLNETLRYWGVGAEPNECVLILARKALNDMNAACTFKEIHSVFDCRCSGDECTIGPVSVKSSHLASLLYGCSRAIVVAVTAGLATDRLIARYNGVNMAYSTALSAAGSALTEEYLNTLCEELKAEQAHMGNSLTARFSPGYGDLPLSFQTSVFTLLNVTARIGITLTDSLLMIPSKSITAIIGIKDAE